jgi:cell division protein ZapA
MPLVNVMINGRAYTIACDDGEEAHLKDLAAHVDGKAREVLGSVGQVGETRMLLMAALLIADEHHDLVAKVAAGGAAARGSSEDTQKLHLKAEQAESQAADALESAAKKLEDIAARLAHA